MKRDLTDNASLRDLKEPVALYFSYVDADKYDFYRENKKELNRVFSLYQNELIEHLRNMNYPAVSSLSTLAAHPAAIVVSTSGIQTPFIDAPYAKDFARDIVLAVQNCHHVKPLSFVMGVHIEQLSIPLLRGKDKNRMFEYTCHPDISIQQSINRKYRKSEKQNFVDRMFQEAMENSVDASPLMQKKFDPLNMEEPIYTGRELILEPYTIHAFNDLESRYLNYGTLNYAHAVNYVHDKGFVHLYAKTEDQEYYDDYGIETGAEPEKDTSRQVETIVVPHKNTYQGVEIYIKKNNRRFVIPMENEMWQAFAEYFRAAYLPLTEALKQRRINILKEAKSNGGRAKTYMPVGYTEKDLLLNEYIDEKPLQMEDLLIIKSNKHNSIYFMNWIEQTRKKIQTLKKDSCDRTDTESISDITQAKLLNRH